MNNLKLVTFVALLSAVAACTPPAIYTNSEFTFK